MKLNGVNWRNRLSKIFRQERHKLTQSHTLDPKLEFRSFGISVGGCCGLFIDVKLIKNF